jgi:hypothetical protein
MAVLPATDRISIFGQASQDAIINKRGNMAINQMENLEMNPVNVLTEAVYVLV